MKDFQYVKFYFGGKIFKRGKILWVFLVMEIVGNIYRKKGFSDMMVNKRGEKGNCLVKDKTRKLKG